MGWAGVRELKESSLRPESDSETRLHRVQEETSREEIKLTDRRPTWSGSLTGKGKEIEKAVVSKGRRGGPILNFKNLNSSLLLLIRRQKELLYS